MNRNIIMAFGFATCAILASYAEIPNGYYDALNGKKQAELKAAAKQIVREHTVIAYGNATWEAFSKTDVKIVDGVEYWWDMYSTNLVSVESGHNGLNIEHSVANSWWGKTKNDAYKDLFHLNPSDATANNRKSNYPLGIVETVTWSNDGDITKVGHPASGTCGGAKYVYEPADQYKGDFARAFMYIFTVYDDISWSVDMDDRNFMFDGTAYPSFRPWAYEMLIEWSKNDPVDDKERSRNDAIYEIQHNRNPFIDHPELAEYIWGDKQNLAFGNGGSGIGEMFNTVISVEAYSPAAGLLIVTAHGTPAGAAEVYDASGRLISRTQCLADGDMTLTLERGIYIVSFGPLGTRKVLVR